MKRKRVSPDHESHELCRLLMNHYRKEEHRYKLDVRQNLRPQWMKIEPAFRIDQHRLEQIREPYRLLQRYFLLLGLDGDNGTYRYPDFLARQLLQPWLIGEDGNELRPGAKETIDLLARSSVRRYLHELYVFTSRLNLQWEGEAAEWATAFVHADVIRQMSVEPEDPAPHKESRFVHHLLTIWAMPGEGVVALNKNYSPIADGSSNRAITSAKGNDPLSPFDYLDALEKKAVQQVHDAFGELRTSLEASHIERNGAGLFSARQDVVMLYKRLRCGAVYEHKIKARMRNTATRIKVEMVPQEVK